MRRHSDDLVVGECKDGPTHYGLHRRLDYWVLRRSWRHPAMIGYEVKQSRSDFLQDTKWRDYLALCNELSFVVPNISVVAPEELPQDIGLLRLAGSRLLTVRKAVHRDIESPTNLLIYVLMCRARIGPDVDGNSTEWWRRWAAERKDDADRGYRVGKKLRARYERDVLEARRENKTLRREIDELQEVKEYLSAHGIDPASTYRSVDELRVPKWTRNEVKRAHDALGKLLEDAKP